MPYVVCPTCDVTSYVIRTSLMRAEPCTSCDGPLDDRAERIWPARPALIGPRAAYRDHEEVHDPPSRGSGSRSNVLSASPRATAPPSRSSMAARATTRAS